MQQVGRMSPGTVLPWRPTPLGKGLTLTTHDMHASQLDSCRHCVPNASLHREQLGSWALCGKGENLGQKERT